PRLRMCHTSCKAEPIHPTAIGIPFCWENGQISRSISAPSLRGMSYSIPGQRSTESRRHARKSKRAVNSGYLDNASRCSTRNLKSSISAPDRLSCLLDDEDPARCRQLLRETVFEHVELFYHRIRKH